MWPSAHNGQPGHNRNNGSHERADSCRYRPAALAARRRSGFSIIRAQLLDPDECAQIIAEQSLANECMNRASLEPLVFLFHALSIGMLPGTGKRSEDNKVLT